MKKAILIFALFITSGCAATATLPGTKNAQVEQIRLLTHAIEKQADAMVAIAGAKPIAEPSPSTSPTPKPEEDEESHFGEEPASLIATKGIK